MVSRSGQERRKDVEGQLTQNQLQAVFESSESVRAFVDTAEERGTVEPAEIGALVVEHDLTEIEVEDLMRELERLGIEIAQPAEAAATEDAVEPVEAVPVEVPELSGAADSLQLFLADVGKHRLLTAADEVTLAKRIERGDPVAKRRMIESNLRLVVYRSRINRSGSERIGRDHLLATLFGHTHKPFLSIIVVKVRK